jgi:Protein of unknown function (DUF3108)
VPLNWLAVRTSMAGARTVAAIALLSCYFGMAHAQTKLTARYTLSVAGIPIGEGNWVVDIGRERYTAQSSGRFFGLWRTLFGSEVSAASRGTAYPGRLAPASYLANFSSDHRINDVRVMFRDGAVSELETRPPVPAGPDRIPVTTSLLRGAIDPLAAGLISAPGGGDALSPASCQRTLPIFDGSQRFDIALSFKRMDNVKADVGYQGPAVVCTMTYRPVAGYSPDAFRINYLKSNRDMEMWLAPVPGTRVLAVFRIKIPTMVGTAELRATEFDGRTR